MKNKGWKNESARHSLAARGLKTRIPSKSISITAFEKKNIERSKDRSPGKFEGADNIEFAKALHELTMDGMVDDEVGDVNAFGWFGLIYLDGFDIKEDGKPIVGVIVSEDENGFFTYHSYHTDKELVDDWDEIEQQHDIQGD